MNNYYIKVSMNKQTTLKKRVHLILITIEALDLYILNDTQQKYFTEKYKTTLIELIHYRSQLKFNYYIQIIYLFCTITTHSYVHDIVLELIYGFCNETYSHLTLQYIKRFTYIYNKYNNYDTYSKNKSINMNKIALANLYIINQINTEYSLYYLIKYLNK